MLKQWILLLFFFSILPELDGKRGGFRAGIRKGISNVKNKFFGGKKSGGRVAPQPAPYKPNTGNYGQRRPPPPRSWQGPPPRTWNSGFDQRRYGYRPGYGMGTYSSSRAFRDSFTGALTGYLAFSMGRAIIRNAMGPFGYHGRSYYYNGRPNPRPHYMTCSIPFNRLYENTTTSEVQEFESAPTLNQTTILNAAPMESEDADEEADYEGDGNDTVVFRRKRDMINQNSPPDQILRNVQYEDGTRPKQLMWQCQANTEVCCGTDCCQVDYDHSYQNETHSKGLLAVAVIAVALVLCCLVERLRMRSPSIIGSGNMNTGPPPPQVIYTPVPQNPGGHYQPGYPPPPHNVGYAGQPPPPGFNMHGGQYQPPPYPSA